ncbi:MAG TPA: hypothetical protein VHB77_12305, partial [Planctomycetaceae bacterium]|nr:hypothetical protein [Planctomycetaceae bacterium]
TAYFFRSRSAALRGTEKLREGRPASISDPVPIGAWRAQWWRRFCEGYRVDADWRTQGQSRGAASEWCSIEYPGADLSRLQPALDRHNVTLAEWLAMESMELVSLSPELLYPCIPRWARQRFGLNISSEECRTGLDACIGRGWLRMTNADTDEEIRSLFEREPALLAVPRVALHWRKLRRATIDPSEPTKLVPIPEGPADHWGLVDFSPKGAQLYRMIQSEWLGSDWEDNLLVECPYSWEEHHYCESQSDFGSIIPQHIADGMTVLTSRVVPIGPWCVYWWKQFPSGYRMQTEFCSAAAKALDPTLIS